MATAHRAVGVIENATARRQRAWDKRCEGKSFRKIGFELSISHEQARKDVQHVLDRMTKLEQTSADEYRVQELAKLDEVEFNVLSNAVTGNTGSVLAWLKLSERRATLLGVEPPKRIELAGPDGKPMEVAHTHEYERPRRVLDILAEAGVVVAGVGGLGDAPTLNEVLPPQPDA